MLSEPPHLRARCSARPHPSVAVPGKPPPLRGRELPPLHVPEEEEEEANEWGPLVNESSA
jgi:hypothetical protein